MPLYVAKYNGELCDLIVDAADADAALEILKAHGVEDEPKGFVELPAGLFLAEVRIEGDEGPKEENPALATDVGMALVPFDAAADFIEAAGEEPTETPAG